MRVLLAATLAVAGFGAAASAPAQADTLPVVATFSILGDLAAEVGGDRVTVTTLVGPDGDGHVYQPTPADARAVAGAKLLVENGLGFEGWIDRLVGASGYDGPVVTASEGVDPIALGDEDDHAIEDDDDHAAAAEEEHEHEHEEASAAEEHGHHHHGSVDPHAWQSIANARIYVANIADGLIEADPDGADAYAANRDAYLARLDREAAEIEAAVARLPQDRRTLVTSHDAFGYLAKATGLTFLAPEGVSTESEASAKDVAALIRQIKAEKIGAVFVENITDQRLIEQISAETGATVGGTLYSDALSGPDGPAATYLDMMHHNIVTITSALGS